MAILMMHLDKKLTTISETLDETNERIKSLESSNTEFRYLANLANLPQVDLCFSRKTGRQLRLTRETRKRLERLLELHKVNSSSLTIDQTTKPDVSPPSSSTSRMTTTTEDWDDWDDASQDWVYKMRGEETGEEQPPATYHL